MRIKYLKLTNKQILKKIEDEKYNHLDLNLFRNKFLKTDTDIK